MENNLDDKAFIARWARWSTCSLCEQRYHGVVNCAVGWACWKTYVGRPEGNNLRCMAMGQLGNGLSDANYVEDALTVGEAQLSVYQRFGAPEENILIVQGNLAGLYHALGWYEQSLRMRQDVYFGHLKLKDEEHFDTLREANNYAVALLDLRRYTESKSVLHRTIPVARRVLSDSSNITLTMLCCYANALYKDPGATLNDLRDAVTSFEDSERIARRVLGGAHPTTEWLGRDLQDARAALSAREGDDVSSLCEPLRGDAQYLIRY